jgi:hypothetical protein
MILVPYDEPEDQAWREWRDRGIAQHGTMKANFAFGHKPDIDDRLYKEMRSFLMSRFHNKCAYCETPILRYTVDVEHYRPKGRVTDANRRVVKVSHMGNEYDHPGYFWEVYDWKNLLPSCEFCNRRRHHDAQDATWGKETCFPVEQDRYAWPWDSNDLEKPLLIHPRFEDPNEHLTFIRGINDETGNPFCCVQPKDARGETTKRVLGLNDERLNRPRLDAYAEGWMRFQLPPIYPMGITVNPSVVKTSDDHMQYPFEVLNRAADIFRMAGHMLGQRLLHRLGLGLVVFFVDDGMQAFPLPPFPLRRN